MDLKEIQTFVVLAEYLHYGVAAERLGIAQPQVSRRIASLERALEATLFERSNRRVALTAFGKAFLPEAIALIKKASETELRARELAQGQSQLLTVSVIDAATLDAAPRIVRSFHQRYPDARIAFRNYGAPTAAQLLALTENSADFLFSHPPQRVPDYVEQIRLVNDPLVAVVPADHHLAGRDHIDLFELAGDPWIMFPRANDPPVYDRMIGLCEGVGFSPKIVYETGHMLTRLGLIASGYGVHLVHRAWMSMPFPGVSYIAVTPTMNIVVSCFWRRDNDSDLLRKMVAIARGYEV